MNARDAELAEARAVVDDRVAAVDWTASAPTSTRRAPR
jgi:hypothetical protein